MAFQIRSLSHMFRMMALGALVVDMDGEAMMDEPHGDLVAASSGRISDE